MQLEQSNLYLHHNFRRSNIFQIEIVSSPLQHFLRTISDDAWPLIEFTPWEKQKDQITFTTKAQFRRRASVVPN